MSIALQVERVKNGKSPQVEDEGRVGLFGERLAFQWNESVWSRVAERFLDEYRAMESADNMFEAGGGEGVSEEVQPIWDFDTPPKTEENQRHNEDDSQEDGGEEELDDTNEENEKAPGLGKGGPSSCVRSYEWAWFVPAHVDIESFGIWFSPSRTLRIIHELRNFGIEDEKDAAILALFMGFWQTCAHGWIEALCTLAESVNGDDSFSPSWRKYPHGIVMENAIAATLSNGMSRMFFQSRSDKDMIFGAMEGLYGKVKNGYEKYSKNDEMKWWPTYRPLFQKNIFALISHKAIYSLDHEIAEYVIGQFYEPSAFLLPHSMRRRPEPNHSIGRVPLLEPRYFKERYPISCLGVGCYE